MPAPALTTPVTEERVVIYGNGANRFMTVATVDQRSKAVELVDDEGSVFADFDQLHAATDHPTVHWIIIDLTGDRS